MALSELRSTQTASEFQSKQKEESAMTKLRKMKKFDELSRKYARKGGMLLGPPGSDSGVLDADIDIKAVNAMTGSTAEMGAEEQHAARTKSANSKAGGSRGGEGPENGLEGVEADRVEGEGAGVGEAGLDGGPSLASQMTGSLGVMENSLDMDDLGSLLSSLGLPGSVQGVGDSLATSIAEKTNKGRRTQAIAKTCKKYESWERLEMALTGGKSKAGGLPPNNRDRRRSKSPSRGGGRK